MKGVENSVLTDLYGEGIIKVGCHDYFSFLILAWNNSQGNNKINYEDMILFTMALT